jgi:hypothetical protein
MHPGTVRTARIAHDPGSPSRLAKVAIGPANGTQAAMTSAQRQGRTGHIIATKNAPARAVASVG